MAYSKEEKESRAHGKELADNISGYLNQIEEILNHPMSDQEKGEVFNQIALLIGKTMVSFCAMCDHYGVYKD